MSQWNEARAIELLAKALRCDPEEKDDSYLFSVRVRSEKVDGSIKKTTISDIIAELNGKSAYASLGLLDDKTIELLVRDESPFPARSFRGDFPSIRDDDNGVSYIISSPTDAYLLFFLDLIMQHTDAKYFLRRHSHPAIERQLSEPDTPHSPFDLLRITTTRISTVQVKSDVKKSSAQMSRLANAFLFQLAFNTDIALVPQQELDALSRSGRISRMRRNRPSEIDPPRRTYHEDLIHHYLLAVSTDNPLVGYLSYYHVLEHFYEAVFNDDLILTIQNQITQPAFSYRRKKDIKGLINSIRKSLKIRNDTITFSEEAALRLTLGKFIVVSDLVKDLDEYDSALIDYYRDNKVPFSGGNQIDLRSGEIEVIQKKLAKRIYQTRNALVHSKDGDKAKYTPFADDHALTKELPLLRFISEQTILRDSKLIE